MRRTIETSLCRVTTSGFACNRWGLDAVMYGWTYPRINSPEWKALDNDLHSVSSVINTFERRI